jgi:hypothetical protein
LDHAFEGLPDLGAKNTSSRRRKGDASIAAD